MSEHQLRTLDQILSLADGGGFLADVLNEHQELQLSLVNHRQNYGGKAKGSLTLKISYELDGHGAVQQNCKLTVKQPEAPAAQYAKWMTDDGHLTPNNPRQTRMQIRDTDTGRRELRAAD